MVRFCYFPYSMGKEDKFESGENHAQWKAIIRRLKPTNQLNRAHKTAISQEKGLNIKTKYKPNLFHLAHPSMSSQVTAHCMPSPGWGISKITSQRQSKKVIVRGWKWGKGEERPEEDRKVQVSDYRNIFTITK